MPGMARAPQLPEQGSSSPAEDSSEGYQEEAPGGPGEKSPSPAEQPGNFLHLHCPAVGAALGVTE